MNIFNLIFLVVIMMGTTLILMNKDDPEQNNQKGQKKDALGLRLIIGANILSQIYNIMTGMMTGDMKSIIFNVIFFFAIIIASFFITSNFKDNHRGLKREWIGLMILLGTTTLMLVYNITLYYI